MSDVQAPCPITGDLMGDVAKDRVEREWCLAVNEFIAAVVAGHRDAWLEERGFSPAAYPEPDNGSVVADLLSRIRDPQTRSIFECERCGRIHIQTAPFTNEWRSYRPDSGSGYQGVLTALDAT